MLFLGEELNISGDINHSTVNGTSLAALSLSYMDDVSCERTCLLESKRQAVSHANFGYFPRI